MHPLIEWNHFNITRNDEFLCMCGHTTIEFHFSYVSNNYVIV